MWCFLILPVLLISCVHQPIVQAPTVYAVEPVTPVVQESYPEPEDTGPHITWEVNPVIPEELGAENYFDEANKNADGSIFRRDYSIATFFPEKDGSLAFRCSGNLNTLHCGTDLTILNAKCSDMLFSIVCFQTK